MRCTASRRLCLKSERTARKPPVVSLSSDNSTTSSAVVLRTLALLAAADEDQLRVLALSQRLFWRRLERRMEEIERSEDAADQNQEQEEEQRGVGQGREGEVSSEEEEVEGGAAAAALADGRRQKSARKSTDSEDELSELLRIFQLLASHSLAKAENSPAGAASSSGSVALENLVFPTALSRRR